MANYLIADMNEVAPVPCPCGQARRAFNTDDNAVATQHVTDISAESRVHYHKKLTEIYLVLEGEGHMELDGERVPVKPMTSILIKPGCRHRAVGKLRVAITVIPPFDAEDEWFDE
jgi:mannose-6-phosphate isomerase-like protein (cupin superfamily)